MIGEKDIYGLFLRQLEAIKNSGLREKVVKCFVLGCGRGNWQSVQDLKKMPFTLLTNTEGINFIEHTIAVTEGAAGLARAQLAACAALPYTIDFDRLFAGGLLHDVGKLLEIEPDGKGGFHRSLSGLYTRHPISGALLAGECGLAGDIVNTIACHSREGDGQPQVIETVLIHQADFAAFNPLVMKQKGTLIQG